MILIETVCGNLRDADWAQRLSGAEVDRLKLDQWDAQKNRFRRKSEGGVELAVSLRRGTFLRDGDILVWEAEQQFAVVADIALKEVLVVETAALLQADPQVMLRTAMEIGHALGNQHWPAVVKGTRIFVPMAVDRKVMASVMKTHAFEGISYDFLPGHEVIPYLAPHESRRLFGGAETPMAGGDNQRHAHSHSHAHGHDHSHDHPHG